MKKVYLMALCALSFFDVINAKSLHDYHKENKGGLFVIDSLSELLGQQPEVTHWKSRVRRQLEEEVENKHPGDAEYTKCIA